MSSCGSSPPRKIIFSSSTHNDLNWILSTKTLHASLRSQCHLYFIRKKVVFSYSNIHDYTTGQLTCKHIKKTCMDKNKSSCLFHLDMKDSFRYKYLIRAWTISLSKTIHLGTMWSSLRYKDNLS